MVTVIVIVLIVLAIVALASLPFVVRAREDRRRRQVPGEPSPTTLPPAPLPGDVLVEEPPAPAPSEVAAPPEPAPSDVAEAELEIEPAVEVPPSFRDRLAKARSTVSGYLGSVLSRGVDDRTWDELEEALIRADVGVSASTQLIERLQEQARSERITDSGELLTRLKAELRASLEADRALCLEPGRTNVWLFVGVNGVGKTTTIGKVGKRLADDGHRVVMAAGDTFRAAAAEQLATWADRASAVLVRGQEGADPSSVVFDGVQAAAARDADVVLADTAGRLHTKVNLMDELAKVRRVADKDPGHATEVLLVIDATTGQNGLQQARQFTAAVEVTGVVLTKLDGSAKGGIVFAIHDELGIPVKLVGLGEGVADLVEFDPDEFVEALFAVD